jgi:folate/biopterin transporter
MLAQKSCSSRGTVAEGHVHGLKGSHGMPETAPLSGAVGGKKNEASYNSCPSTASGKNSERTIDVSAEQVMEPECEAEPKKEAGTAISSKQHRSFAEQANFVVNSLLWLARLKNEYGQRLLLLLFASQHLIKGVVQQFQTSSVMWLLREYRVDGPQMQVFVSMANSAWALKPLIGMVSDLVPIYGYRKAPYIVITACIGVGSALTIGVSTRATVTVGGIVACLFGIQLQTSTTDLLTEATYSEHIQERPAMGPDLISYVWGGITIGNMVAISMVSFLIVNFGPREVFLACIIPCAAIVYPTLKNYFGEVVYTRRQLSRVRAEFIKQREVLFLCVLMTLLTLLLTFVGASSASMELRFYVGIGIMIMLIPSFNLLLRPEIAQVNTFFMLQAALSMNIQGASFYFYTDDADQYPEGPHFSPWFYTSTLGFVSSIMSLLGLAVYTNYMKNWTYRSLLLFSNITLTLLSLLDVLMFLRMPKVWGIPDKFFVMGSSVSYVVIKQWQWMPGVVITSQLCPTGMEATIFALLAGCMNLGTQVADYSGAYLLENLGVHPSGAVGESDQFKNLWKASLCATLLPALTILLIPVLMPNARQTETLLMRNPSSATAGSPLYRMLENMQPTVDSD